MGGLVALAMLVGYHRRMIPRREAMMQLARLVGLPNFLERFGSPQTAEPDAVELTALVEERIDEFANGLIAEAAAGDDVIDTASAREFLDDRLKTFRDLISEDQKRTLRATFAESTKDW